MLENAVLHAAHAPLAQIARGAWRIVAVFLVTWIVIGSAGSAAVVVGVVLMIIVDMVGVMAVWNISLNAVSLVNLVMALGISVEFCSHLTRAFTISSGTRQARAQFALIDVGASVR